MCHFKINLTSEKVFHEKRKKTTIYFMKAYYLNEINKKYHLFISGGHIYLFSFGTFVIP